MSFFTLILILLCIYAPWAFPVLFVVLFFAWIYYLSPALFWILNTLLVLIIIFVIIYECNERKNIPPKKYRKKRY